MGIRLRFASRRQGFACHWHSALIRHELSCVNAPIMSDTITFLSTRVAHARLRPKRNSFRYRVPYVAIPARLLGARRSFGLFSIDAFNLLSVRTGDYGHENRHGLDWVHEVLTHRGLEEAGGYVELVTIPRVLGLAFNPVSFWLCFDGARALRAVIAEVNNTFGERHFYVCAHADHRPIGPEDRLTAEKVFHVSPFMKVEGHYAFTFSAGGDSLGVRIDLHDAEGLILTTSLAGRREAPSSRRLALAFLANPLLMLKVLGLIHYQALRLWAKGVAPVRKPAPPTQVVSG